MEIVLWGIYIWYVNEANVVIKEVNVPTVHIFLWTNNASTLDDLCPQVDAATFVLLLRYLKKDYLAQIKQFS